MRNYDIFVAKIYEYALIDSFGGFPGFIDCLTSYATLLSAKTISRPRNISLPFFKGTLRASSGPSIEWCGTDWTPSNPLLLRQPLTADNLPNAPHLIGLGFFKKCRITQINAINCKCPALNQGKIFWKRQNQRFWVIAFSFLVSFFWILMFFCELQKYS